MISPPYLKTSDTIGLLSTARKITSAELDFAIQTFESWGLKTALGKSINAVERQFAGTDEVRAENFQEMLDNPEIKAIICARGGYGTVRIIDQIDFSNFKKRSKWIAGYSDLTVLHAHIHSNFGIETIHSSMPLNFQKNSSEALESLRQALFGNPLGYEIPPHPFNVKGKAKGILVGGNLSVLYSISGSKSDLDTKGKILFLEDLDEYLYHVDRMFMQLKRSGKLDKLKGAIIGGFTEMKDNEIPFGKNAEEIIHSHFREFDFPVMFGFPAGHLSDNRVLYLGRKIEMEVSDEGSKIKF